MVQSPWCQNGVQSPIIIALMFLAFARSAGASEQFTQQFDTDRVNTRILRFIGPAKSGAMTETEKGLVIRLPVEKQGATQAGIATRFMVKGDFEITVRYELVDVPKPEKGYGAGVVLRLSRPEPTQTQAGLGRRKRLDGSDVFNAIVSSNDSGQSKSNQKFLPAKADSGRLRLVRNGATLHFLVADGDDEEFRELRQVEFGTEPVKSVFVLGDTGNSDDSITIRIKSLSIQAESLPVGSPERRRNFFWSASTVIVLVGGLVLAGCCIWYWRR